MVNKKNKRNRKYNPKYIRAYIHTLESFTTQDITGKFGMNPKYVYQFLRKYIPDVLYKYKVPRKQDWNYDDMEISRITLSGYASAVRKEKKTCGHTLTSLCFLEVETKEGIIDVLIPHRMDLELFERDVVLEVLGVRRYGIMRYKLLEVL